MSILRTLPRGIVTALVTPVHVDGAVDLDALDRVLDHTLAGGVSGVSTCGSTGEGARLTTAQRLQVARRVRDRMPPETALLPAVPLTTPSEGAEEIAELARLDVTAVLVAPPSYYPASGTELVRLYTSLADAAAVPLVLYNIPMFTQALPVGTVTELAAHPGVAGVKDSSRDVEYLQALLAATEGQDFAVYTGSDTLLLPSMVLGAHGAITASANLVPALGVQVFDLTSAGRYTEARERQRQLARVVATCRAGAFPAGWKAAAHLAGRCAPDLVPPAEAMPVPARAELERALRDLGVLGG